MRRSVQRVVESQSDEEILARQRRKYDDLSESQRLLAKKLVLNPSGMYDSADDDQRR